MIPPGSPAKPARFGRSPLNRKITHTKNSLTGQTASFQTLRIRRACMRAAGWASFVPFCRVTVSARKRKKAYSGRKSLHFGDLSRIMLIMSHLYI